MKLPKPIRITRPGPDLEAQMVVEGKKFPKHVMFRRDLTAAKRHNNRTRPRKKKS